MSVLPSGVYLCARCRQRREKDIRSPELELQSVARCCGFWEWILTSEPCFQPSVLYGSFVCECGGVPGCGGLISLSVLQEPLVYSASFICLFLETQSHFVVLADLEFTELCLPLPLEYWDCRHVPPPQNYLAFSLRRGLWDTQEFEVSTCLF